MIRYALRCAEGHRFESWFQSAAGYESLRQAGHVACAICGGTEVEKDLMAPSLGSDETPRDRAPGQGARPLSGTPANVAEQAMAELRRRIEEKSEYVGGDFAREARAIHEGEAQERPIWGEAKREDAKKLLEDGVRVAPLPFLPKRNTN